jgi:hypothetical protein
VPYQLAGEDARLHRFIRIASTAVVVLSVAWGITITKMISDFDLLTSSTDPLVWVLHLLSVVVFIGAAAVGVWNAIVVVRGQRKWYTKLWAVLLALGLLVTLWAALAFHLIAFNANY